MHSNLTVQALKFYCVCTQNCAHFSCAEVICIFIKTIRISRRGFPGVWLAFGAPLIKFLSNWRNLGDEKSSMASAEDFRRLINGITNQEELIRLARSLGTGIRPSRSQTHSGNDIAPGPPTPSRLSSATQLPQAQGQAHTAQFAFHTSGNANKRKRTFDNPR